MIRISRFAILGTFLVAPVVVWASTLFGDLVLDFQCSREGNFISTGFAIGTFFFSHDPSHTVDFQKGLRFDHHQSPSLDDLGKWAVGQFRFHAQSHDPNYHFTRFPLGPLSLTVPLWPLPAIALTLIIIRRLTRRGTQGLAALSPL